MTDTARSLLAAARADWSDRGLKLVLADALDDADLHRDAALWRVLAEPWEDRHRLNYADVCEREGDGERAEFIRVQIELAQKLSEPGWIPPDYLLHTDTDSLQILFQINNHAREKRIEELRRHERDLFKSRQVKRFLPKQLDATLKIVESPHDLHSVMPQALIVRGFVSHLTCSWADWRDYGDMIRECQPVERVRLTDWPRIDDRWAYSDDREAFLASCWPGIEFELPPNMGPPPGDLESVDAYLFRELTRRQAEAINTAIVNDRQPIVRTSFD